MKRIILLLQLSAITLAMPAQTFTEVIPIQCGDTALIGNLGYPTWSVPHIVKRPSYGHALLLGDFIQPNLLQYTVPLCFSGRDTVVIECARATQITCDTGIYVFEITCPNALSTVYATEVDCRGSVYVNNLSGWFGPVMIQPAQHGQAQVILEPTDGAGVQYRPNPGFEGLDFVKVSLFNGADTLLYIFQIYCNLLSRQSEISTITPALYPNPASDLLYIEANEELDKLILLDPQGKQIPVQGQWERNLYRIDVRPFPPGVYFISGVNAKGARFGLKWVKVE